MDLPLDPHAKMRKSMLGKMKRYCEIDNINTAEVFNFLLPVIMLRGVLSERYYVDVRSKSDAQLAEAVIKSELHERYDMVAKAPKFDLKARYRYTPPDNLKFKTKECQKLLHLYSTLPITVNKTGNPVIDFNHHVTRTITPDDMEDFVLNLTNIRSVQKWQRLITADPKDAFQQYLRDVHKQSKYKLKIGQTEYTFGMGGIHSCEKSAMFTDDFHRLMDSDVAAYYPRVILNNGFYPRHLGKGFLKVYENIVNMRLKAKAEGDADADRSLKIVINGSFGKLGSRWSCLYSPDLLTQVTVTGQLSLLMLIEELELNGIRVVSANTDGIVTLCPDEKEDLRDSIMVDWEKRTNYQLEHCDYSVLASRDVNNYIAIPADTEKTIKGKGEYADQSDDYNRLRNNPNVEICAQAVKLFLKDGTPLVKTIKGCRDLAQFLSVRKVNGGAVFQGKEIGKVVRWYRSTETGDETIRYKTSGNKVPLSDSARPVVKLSRQIPKDLDYNYYLNKCDEILNDIGYNA